MITIIDPHLTQFLCMCWATHRKGLTKRETAAYVSCHPIVWKLGIMTEAIRGNRSILVLITSKLNLMKLSASSHKFPQWPHIVHLIESAVDSSSGLHSGNVFETILLILARIVYCFTIWVVRGKPCWRWFTLYEHLSCNLTHVDKLPETDP